MLPKTSRLRAFEVAEVLARGTHTRVGPYAGKMIESKDPLRVAVIVPKKTAKSAVARNRLRRAVYRAVAALAAQKTGRLALFVRSK